MRLHRIYYPFSAKLNEEMTIEGDRAHYIKNVLRLKLARKVRLFNGKGQEFFAEIIALGKKSLQLCLLEEIDSINPSKLNIRLVQSLSKGERMDYTVQKATELGIDTIQPITSEYCEVRLSGPRLEKKLKHWKNIAISACEQSFRADIPNILTPITLADYTANKHLGILLEPEENNSITDLAKMQWQEFDVVVGPEGGWSEKDLHQLKSTGLTGMKFGQRVLRTETVAPAILAAIHSLWGDFV